MLAITKMDLPIKDQQGLEAAAGFAKTNGWLFYKTSSKTGLGIDEMFEALILKKFNMPVSHLQPDYLRQLYSKRQLSIPLGDHSRAGTFSRMDSKDNGDKEDSSGAPSPSKWAPKQLAVDSWQSIPEVKLANRESDTAATPN